MHMLSSKGLNSAELETVRVSESPTMVVTATGEVQTKEEATVYVKELDLLEDTLAALTRKTLRGSRIFLRADQWSETTARQRWQTNKMRH